MRNVIWLAVGVVLGFAAAHFAARTPAGSALFGAVDGRARSAVSAFVSGYRGREAELRAATVEAEVLPSAGSASA
jgi:hypothetical protein